VRERAVLEVFAGLAARFEVRRAELCLVLVRMVELFHSVVCSVALVTASAVRAFASHVGANLRLVGAKRSAPVFVEIVVEWTSLEVMILRFLLTWLDFERV